MPLIYPSAPFFYFSHSHCHALVKDSIGWRCVFRKSLQRSKPEDCNPKPGHPSNNNYATVGAVIGPNCLERSVRVDWNCDHTFQTIVQIKKQVHKANMETYQNDDYKAYGWCSLLATDKWNTYIKDPLNENARSAFIAKMTNKEKFPQNTSPPYGIFYKSMTVTVGKNRKRAQMGRSKALEWIRYDPNYSHDTTCKEEK